MNTPEKELKHCTACNQMTNHSGEKCLKHTPDTEWESVFNYSVETGLLKRFFKLYEEGRKTGDPQNFVDYFKAEHYLLTEVGKAIFSRDTHWNERVQKEKEDIFGEIEQFKSEVATMNYNDDFKDGIYATIEHILSMPCFESVLTPITE